MPNAANPNPNFEIILKKLFIGSVLIAFRSVSGIVRHDVVLYFRCFSFQSPEFVLRYFSYISRPPWFISVDEASDTAVLGLLIGEKE